MQCGVATLAILEVDVDAWMREDGIEIADGPRFGARGDVMKNGAAEMVSTIDFGRGAGSRCVLQAMRRLGEGSATTTVRAICGHLCGVGPFGRAAFEYGAKSL